MKKMEQAITQQAQQQETSKIKPSKKTYPLWFWLVSGVMISGWLVLMRWIWKGKKISKKNK